VIQLSQERHGDVLVVRVREAKLTYPVLSSFFDEMRRIVEGGARKLVIDLDAVTYIDSASIGCLMDIHRLIRGREGAAKLSGVQPRVRTMLSLIGVHKVLEAHLDEAEALAAFGRPSEAKQGLAARAAGGAPSPRPGD
jgi:anti-anti-sigma factor